MSTELKEPWQTEADAKLAAMEVALKVMADERDDARREIERLREACRKAYMLFAMRSEPYIPPYVRERVEAILQESLNAPTPAKPC